MPQRRTKLEPWIEKIILNHDTELEISTGRLKAHVVGVSQMSCSQAQVTEGPTGLLLLSDGVVQIPAVLTESAWENLQEQEDRECFSSLVNTTVFLQSYHLQFHMALEQAKCRFFLSVGELATTAAGTVKDNTPCCTSLPSVQLKISKTWRNLLSQDLVVTQNSQCGFDLSELLGEWHHNCMEAMLEDVRERLAILRRPVSPQPSTSSCIPSVLHSDTCTGTEWDAERIRHKGTEPFSIPLTDLLIPEEAERPHMQSDEGSETQSRLFVPSEDRERNSLPALQDVHAVQPTVNYLKLQTAKLAVMERRPEVGEQSLPEEIILNEDMVVRMMHKAKSNPWDIFPPPSDVLNTSSCSDKSMTSNIIPPLSQNFPSTIASQTASVAVITSTQIPCQGQGVSEASGQSREEHYFLSPYQKPQPTSSLVANSSSSAAGSQESISRPLNLSKGVEANCSQVTQHFLLVSDQENVLAERDTEMQGEVIQRKCKMVKRKRTEDTPDDLTAFEEEGEAQIAWSPPSWLYETQFSRTEVRNSLKQDKATGTIPRKVSTFHSDGTKFSYSYTVSDQTMQNFSKFKVDDNLAHWAVKYLLVQRQTAN
ncbi:adrenocortical dysplasia protein homolog [Lampris incognitus]|uniref:adrenocortical dysplasia protein homolog n=1 Tax=Lampris incognitus TaxID=2546036 RepID=UPI0024B4B520|nr:adrenocortical dysplasia protein homolog [Lampris incognitus]